MLPMWGALVVIGVISVCAVFGAQQCVLRNRWAAFAWWGWALIFVFVLANGPFWSR